MTLLKFVGSYYLNRSLITYPFNYIDFVSPRTGEQEEALRHRHFRETTLCNSIQAVVILSMRAAGKVLHCGASVLDGPFLTQVSLVSFAAFV